MNTARHAGPVLALVLVQGCVGVRSDLRDLESLTGTPRLADVTRDVSAEDAPETRTLLAAPVDVDAVVRVALTNNRELRARLREIGVARGQLLQESLPPNPVLEGDLQPERDAQVILRAEYDITGLVLAPVRASAAAPEVDAARWRAASAVVTTGFAARAAFYTLEAAEQKLALGQHTLDALGTARQAAQAYFAAGNVTELDLATHEATFERERAEVTTMELEAQRAREALVRALGVQGVAFALKGTLAPPPAQLDAPGDLEARAVRASFELRERRAHLLALGRRVSATRAEGWIPDVAVDLHGIGPNPNPRDTADTLWQLGAGVRVTVPLLDRKDGAAAKVSSELAAGLERYYGAVTDIRSGARLLRATLTTAHARARQYETVIVPARQRVVDQTLLQYNAMQVGIFQLLEAKRAELAAELAAVDAVRDYWIARSAVDAALVGRNPTTERGNE